MYIATVPLQDSPGTQDIYMIHLFFTQELIDIVFGSWQSIYKSRLFRKANF